MTVEMISIPVEEYNRLCKDSQLLDKLYRAGVDNWEWYGDAIGEDE